MNKKILLIITILLLTTITTVSANCGLSPIEITGTTYRGDTLTITTTISNNCTNNITANINWSDLINNTNNISATAITITPNNPAINNGSTQTINYEITIPTITIPELTYNGLINTTYDNGSGIITDTTTASITVLNENPILNIGTQNAIIGQEKIIDLATYSSDSFDTITNYELITKPSSMNINNTTGLINGWTPTNNIPISVTARITDSYGGSATETFTINPIANVPKITIDENTEILLGGPSQDRETNTATTTTIKNTGAQNITITNIELTTTTGNPLNTIYATVISLSSTTLSPGGEAIATINIYVPENTPSEKVTLGRLEVTAENNASLIVSDVEMVYLQARSNLEITNVEITVDGDEETVSLGEYIEVQEESQIELSVTVTNTYSLAQDITIKNVYFEVEDNEDYFIEENSNEKNIDAQEEKTLTVNFKIPLTIDEEETTLTIKVYGDDEQQNFEHYSEYEFYLELERVDDKLIIGRIDWYEELLTTGTTLALGELDIINRGLEDQSGATLEIICEELNFSETTILSDLDSLESTTIPLEIVINKDFEGEKTVKLILRYGDGNIADYKETILEMFTNYQPPTNTPPVEETITNEQPTQQLVSAVQGESQPPEDIAYLILLTTGIIVFIVLIWLIITHSRKKNDSK